MADQIEVDESVTPSSEPGNSSNTSVISCTPLTQVSHEELRATLAGIPLGGSVCYRNKSGALVQILPPITPQEQPILVQKPATIVRVGRMEAGRVSIAPATQEEIATHQIVTLYDITPSYSDSLGSSSHLHPRDGGSRTAIPHSPLTEQEVMAFLDYREDIEQELIQGAHATTVPSAPQYY